MIPRREIPGPAGFARRPHWLQCVDRPHRASLFNLAPVANALGKNRSECGGDADGLIELLHGPFDIVVRLENRVRVQDEFDVGIKLACLPFDRRRLSDGRSALDGDQIDLLQCAKRFRAFDGSVVASVVDKDDAPDAESLPRDRLET